MRPRTPLLFFAVLALVVGTMARAEAAGSSARAALAGNTASSLLRASVDQGRADLGAHVDLIVGLRFNTPPGKPDLASYVQDTVTPGSPYFHVFLTPQQFQAEYGPPADAVAALERYLEGYGLRVSRTENVNGAAYTVNDYLHVSGTVGEVEAAFEVPVNQFTYQGRSFLANTQDPTLPTDYEGYDLAALVSGISGLLTFSAFHSMAVNQVQFTGAQPSSSCAGGGYADCTAPEGLAPQDVARIYDAQPVYQAGITGTGRTIAVATLAPIYTADPQAYWAYYGVARTGSLSEIGVDQTIPPGGASGYGQGGSETDLDVEQAGAMAPGANIEVYAAPNSANGFVDLFNAVVNGFGGTLPDVMTVSWGQAETFETPGYAAILNQLWEQGAAEGITMLAASGDSGAYDAYGAVGWNRTPVVDSPADLTYAAAVGGTTLGTSQTSGISTLSLPALTACRPLSEQGWGWDYLLPCFGALDFKNRQTAENSLFPVGSGGGFSVYFAQPPWQVGYGGAQLAQGSGKGVPDVSFNADPFTGWSIYDSSSIYTTSQAPWTDGWGGTSFGAPNWAGVVALVDQSVGGPIGLLAPTLYALQGQGLRDIATGDNWLYHAGAGWDAVTGLGVPDVAQLVETIDSTGL